jgi:hypothetical protein
MPPWHIDRSVGVQKFKNDMSLTDEQVATVVAWVDGGALEGNPADFKAKPVTKGLYWQAERDGYGPPTSSSAHRCRRCPRCTRTSGGAR